MKISTWNVNGIRAREAQILEWIRAERPDVLCLQEIKASPEDVPESLCGMEDYWCFWHGHKGYSGVGINLRRDVWPVAPEFFHPGFDHENRIVATRLGDLVIASIYVPNGNKDYPAKIRFLEALRAFVHEEHVRGSKLLLCGDLNVALEERDVHPVMQKPTQIGQTEEERALMRSILNEGLVDLLRHFHPNDDRLFTWWAPWRNFRQRNFGWRLDYVLASGTLAKTATRCDAFREFGTSDHGPVTAELDAPFPQPRCGSEEAEQGGETVAPTITARREAQLPLEL